MVSDYSFLLGAIERRARRLRGARTAVIVAASTAALTLVAAVVLRWTGIGLPLLVQGALVGLTLAAAAIAYVVGRTRRARLDTLLLRIDERLGLDARLSSLYELRRRGGDSVFRRRLERELLPSLVGWRGALPLGVQSVAVASAAVACLAATLVLAALPPLPSSASLLDNVDRAASVPPAPASGRPQRTEPADRASPPPLTAGDEPALDEPVSPASGEASPDGPSLADDLGNTAARSPTGAAFGDSAHDLDELARRQQEAARGLGEWLERIRQRMEDDGDSRLTDEERQALEEHLARGGIAPEVSEAVREWSERPPSGDGRQRVEQLLEQLLGDDEDRDSGEDGRPSSPRTTAIAPGERSDEEGLETWPGEDGAEAGPPPGHGDRTAGRPADAGPTTDMDGRGEPSAPGENGNESPDPTGGTTGAPGAVADRGEEPGFVRERDPAAFGSEGAFGDAFLTEGVPVDRAAPAESNDGEHVLAIRYDRIDAILRPRGIPEGAIDIVRAYFDAITEGDV